MSDEVTSQRFLTVDQTAAELNVSDHQIRSMLHTGELRGIQIGGRGIWRVGRVDVESYIENAYRKTAARIAAGEFSDDSSPGDP